MNLSKMGYAVLYEARDGETRWVWLKDEAAALHFADGMVELGRPRPVVIQAQEVR